MLHSSTFKFALAAFGLANVVHGSTLLYARDPAWELSCEDTTSFPCGPTICCAPAAYCQDVNDVPTCQPPPTTPAPTCADPSLVHCSLYDHCCPAGQACSTNSAGGTCDGNPAPGTEPVATPEEVCTADGYFWCTQYSLCCIGVTTCSASDDGTGQCGTRDTVVPPVTPNPPTTPNPNPANPNPPAGNNGSTTRTTSRTSSTSSRSSTSSTASATTSGNAAVKGATGGAFGLVGAGLMAALLV